MAHKAVERAKRKVGNLVIRNAKQRSIRRAIKRLERRQEVLARKNLQDLYEEKRLGNHL